jgi:RNA-directed DNA polymerase
MLKLARLDHLATRLGVSVTDLRRITSNVPSYCQEMLLIDPEKPDKHREVIKVSGELREIQERLYRRVLLPKLKPSIQSHGGVHGRHILTGVSEHKNSTFLFTTDISSFFPSISYRRIYNLFQQRFMCSPDVSRECTLLCTFRHHLALGLITSPILADQIALPIDRRIFSMAARLKLVYTRFVDDVAVSGQFDLDEKTSSIPQTVSNIFSSCGFAIQRKKHTFGRLDHGHSITKIQIKNGHFDVQTAYVEKIEQQLNFARKLAAGERTEGLYYCEGQVRGRVEFVKWVNPGRGRQLLRKFQSVQWDLVRKKAMEFGLETAKVRLIPKTS